MICRIKKIATCFALVSSLAFGNFEEEEKRIELLGQNELEEILTNEQSDDFQKACAAINLLELAKKNMHDTNNFVSSLHEVNNVIKKIRINNLQTSVFIKLLNTIMDFLHFSDSDNKEDVTDSLKSLFLPSWWATKKYIANRCANLNQSEWKDKQRLFWSILKKLKIFGDTEEEVKTQSDSSGNFILETPNFMHPQYNDVERFKLARNFLINPVRPATTISKKIEKLTLVLDSLQAHAFKLNLLHDIYLFTKDKKNWTSLSSIKKLYKISALLFEEGHVFARHLMDYFSEQEKSLENEIEIHRFMINFFHELHTACQIPTTRTSTSSTSCTSVTPRTYTLPRSSSPEFSNRPNSWVPFVDVPMEAETPDTKLSLIPYIANQEQREFLNRIVLGDGAKSKYGFNCFFDFRNVLDIFADDVYKPLTWIIYKGNTPKGTMCVMFSRGGEAGFGIVFADDADYKKEAISAIFRTVIQNITKHTDFNRFLFHINSKDPTEFTKAERDYIKKDREVIEEALSSNGFQLVDTFSSISQYLMLH